MFYLALHLTKVLFCDILFGSLDNRCHSDLGKTTRSRDKHGMTKEVFLNQDDNEQPPLNGEKGIAVKKGFLAAAVGIAVAFVLIVIVAIIVRSCVNHPEGLVIRWVYPPDHVPYGVVSVEGTYNEAGRQHPWQALCEMERVASNEYACPVNIPAGGELLFAIRYVDSKTDKTCWTFDYSNDKPCGGNGAHVGEVKLAYETRPISYTLVSNGIAGPSGSATYFNAKTEMP